MSIQFNTGSGLSGSVETAGTSFNVSDGNPPPDAAESLLWLARQGRGL